MNDLELPSIINTELEKFIWLLAKLDLYLKWEELDVIEAIMEWEDRNDGYLQ